MTSVSVAMSSARVARVRHIFRSCLCRNTEVRVNTCMHVCVVCMCVLVHACMYGVCVFMHACMYGVCVCVVCALVYVHVCACTHA